MSALHNRSTSSAASTARGMHALLSPVLLVSILLTVAVTFGGGGIRYGLANLCVQLAALATLALHREAFFSFWKDSPLALRLLAGLTLALPILHLIPLPQGVWSAFPGRDLVVQSLEASESLGWRAASVDPARTLVAMTGLITPLVVLAVGWKMPRHHLMTVGWVIVALGLVCFAIGIVQVISNGATGVFYSERAPNELLYGTFANRNSTGLFLVCALAFAALLPVPRPHPAALPVRLAICGLLILAVILTRSRTAFVLASIPILLGCARAFAVWRQSRRSGSDSTSHKGVLAVIGAIALGAITLGSVVAIAPGRLSQTIERFEASDDPRTYIWDDAAYSASRYWPIGAGMGTFDEVFQVDESLENLTKRRAGRAHNDYIELAIEAGIPGLALAIAWLILVGWLSWRASYSRFRWSAWGGGAILLAVALQSITDYPLRNQAMLAIAAFAMLILARIATSSDREKRA